MTVYESELRHIAALYQAKRYAQAKEQCIKLLASGNNLESIYFVLFQIANIQKQYDEALIYIDKLIELLPNEMLYYSDKANLYEDLGKKQEAIACYNHFISIQPSHAVAHYNLGLLLKKNGKVAEALEHYALALAFNINAPAEVYLNIGVIYSELNDAEKAKESFNQAISSDNNYISAWFNLGGLYEELGEKRQALQCYMKIMHIEPNHIETIVRILNAKDDVKSNDELVVRLKNIITLKSRQSSPNIEGAYYALGKVYDQNQQFDHAFEFYRLANQLSAKRVNSYDKKKQEHATAQLISHINKQWITENSCTNCISSSPIFICGMFRSGSTLVEKILASHPDVTPGGELNHFYQSIKESGLERLSFTHIHKLQLNTIGQLYSDKLHTFFPDASRVTDKRPDNFLYLGLIKAILPHAKFICTDRDPLDICLSIYFQHLSTSVDYGTELMDIAHYYVEYRKVLSHWQSLIPDSLYVLKYDELVSEPQRVCSEMFSHCGLEWDSQYLNVIGVGNLIKTASLWQVRKPLYKTSSKRWLNYQNNIQKVKIYLDEQLPSCK